MLSASQAGHPQKSAIRVTPAIFQPDNYVFSRKLMVKFGLPEMVNTLG